MCCECSASWSRVDCECGASKSRATCENIKLKNLRIDVDSDFPLGTTEPNPTPPKLTEPHLASASQTGGGGAVSNSVVEEHFDQAKPVEPMAMEDVLVNEFIDLPPIFSPGIMRLSPGLSFRTWSL